MRNSKDFPFDKARRVSAKEVVQAREAIKQKNRTVRPARGRPEKPAGEKYRRTSIRLHPKAIAWAKREGKKRGVGYQTVINEVLLEKSI